MSEGEISRGTELAATRCSAALLISRLLLIHPPVTFHPVWLAIPAGHNNIAPNKYQISEAGRRREGAERERDHLLGELAAD